MPLLSEPSKPTDSCVKADDRFDKLTISPVNSSMNFV